MRRERKLNTSSHRETSKVRFSNLENHRLWSVTELYRRLTNCRSGDIIQSAVGLVPRVPNYYLRGSLAAARLRHNGEIPGRRGVSDGILMKARERVKEKERKSKGEREKEMFAFARIADVVIRDNYRAAMTLAEDGAPAL